MLKHFLFFSLRRVKKSYKQSQPEPTVAPIEQSQPVEEGSDGVDGEKVSAEVQEGRR